MRKGSIDIYLDDLLAMDQTSKCCVFNVVQNWLVRTATCLYSVALCLALKGSEFRICITSWLVFRTIGQEEYLVKS